MSNSFDPRAIKLNSSLEHVDLARDFVADIARQVPMDSKQIYDLELVVTEALTNVMEHAYQGNEERQVQLAVTHQDDEFTIVISHDGASFNPDEHPDPVMKDYLAKRQVGGLGLFLIKKLMDQVEYTTNDEGKRMIKMVKRHPTGRLPAQE